ncbi:MAG: hypothetical protein HYY37_00210 [Candidatus Aenigmarchaeota archaeon]|nr:hypothetical protein [Candidatus Aenigmarchaeota archaeon]
MKTVMALMVLLLVVSGCTSPAAEVPAASTTTATTATATTAHPDDDYLDEALTELEQAESLDAA